jgi:hypothetical protein
MCRTKPIPAEQYQPLMRNLWKVIDEMVPGLLTALRRADELNHSPLLTWWGNVTSTCVGSGRVPGSRQPPIPAQLAASSARPHALASRVRHLGLARVRSGAEPDTVSTRRNSPQIGPRTGPVDFKGRLRRCFHPSGLLAGAQFPQVLTIAPLRRSQSQTKSAVQPDQQGHLPAADLGPDRYLVARLHARQRGARRNGRGARSRRSAVLATAHGPSTRGACPELRG